MYRTVSAVLFVGAILSASLGCMEAEKDRRPEQALSQVNSLLRQWDGTDNVAPLKGHKDAWQNDILVEVKHQEDTLVCEVRSPGADHLPYNSDDVQVSTAKGPPLRDIAGRAVQEVTRGAAKGIRQGIRDKLD